MFKESNMNTLNFVFKKFIYGIIPLFFCKVFYPDSSNIKFYKYIKVHGYARHLFDFREEYEQMHFPVQEDKKRGMHYILNKQGRRLYFRRNTPIEKIEKCYRMLTIEQDIRSPHHYLDSIKEVKGKTFVDVGSAEGFTSLEIIDEATHLYLFEQDELWIEALEATFEPWKEKITITRKYIGNKDNGQEVTLDSFFQDKDKEHLFLKMDIEGAERYALAGSKELFGKHKLNFAICTYHGDDNIVVPDILKKYGCRYIEQYGFFRQKFRSVVARGTSM